MRFRRWALTCEDRKLNLIQLGAQLNTGSGAQLTGPGNLGR